MDVIHINHSYAVIESYYLKVTTIFCKQTFALFFLFVLINYKTFHCNTII